MKSSTDENIACQMIYKLEFNNILVSYSCEMIHNTLSLTLLNLTMTNITRHYVTMLCYITLWK